MLLRTALFAGALFAGTLFGPQEAVQVEANSGGWSEYVRAALSRKQQPEPGYYQGRIAVLEAQKTALAGKIAKAERRAERGEAGAAELMRGYQERLSRNILEARELRMAEAELGRLHAEAMRAEEMDMIVMLAMLAEIV